MMRPESIVLPGDEIELSVKSQGLDGAIFSADRKRRRYLWRHIADPGRRLAFIMLNPSTAGAIETDPTITRCMNFAAREGAGRMEVANVSDFIETDSRKLSGDLTDENSGHYLKYALTADTVILGWGAHPLAAGKLSAFLLNHGLDGLGSIRLLCLGKTRTGQPRHPLFLRSDTPLVEWP